MKYLLTLSLLFAFTISFSQQNKGTIDTIHITGSYYSIDQGKIISYEISINKKQLRNLNECYGYRFADRDNIVFAYTPCGDYSLAKLVVLDKDKFIEFLKVNKLSFK